MIAFPIQYYATSNQPCIPSGIARQIDQKKQKIRAVLYSVALAFPLPFELRITIASPSSSSLTLSTVEAVLTLRSSSTLLLLPNILLSPLRPLWLRECVALELSENKLPLDVLRFISLPLLNRLRLPLLALRFKLPSSIDDASSDSRRFLDGSSDLAFHAA